MAAVVGTERETLPAATLVTVVPAAMPTPATVCPATTPATDVGVMTVLVIGVATPIVVARFAPGPNPATVVPAGMPQAVPPPVHATPFVATTPVAFGTTMKMEPT